MIIDSVTDKSSIGVDRLTVPEPDERRELMFDPMVDISPEDWTAATKVLAFVRKRCLEDASGFNFGNWSNWSTLTRYLALLSPEMRDRIETDEEMEEKLFRVIENRGPQGRVQDGSAFLHLAADAKILFPEHIADLKLNQDAFQLAIDAITNDYGPAHNSSEFRAHLVEAAILFPDRRREFPSLVPVIPYILKSELDWYRENGGWVVFASKLSTLRLVFPEEAEKISKTDWKGMREGLKTLTTSRVVHPLFEYALNMFILAAKDVRILEDGLEINLGKQGEDMTEKIPDMPVKKAF